MTMKVKTNARKVKFWKGQWLIREWSLHDTKRVDLVRFLRDMDGVEFLASHYYSISPKNKVAMVSLDDGERLSYAMKTNLIKVKYNFRLATKEELNKYALIIIKNL